MEPEEVVRDVSGPRRYVPLIEAEEVDMVLWYSRLGIEEELDVVMSTLPDCVEALRRAGRGLSGSASPGWTVAVMEPEEEVRERRSRRVKVPVMGLEDVLRMVLREVQVGRWMGWAWVVMVVVSIAGLGWSQVKRWGEEVTLRAVVRMESDCRVRFAFK